MVVGALSSGEAARRGWLLDGYPRSPEQAQAIDRAGIRPDVFLLLNVRRCCLNWSPAPGLKGVGHWDLKRRKSTPPHPLEHRAC